MDDVFTQFYAQADALIVTLVVDKYAAIADMVRGPLIMSAAIYIAVVGFAVMRGVVSEGWGALMASGFKLALIIAAATGSYGSWVAASANELPNSFSAALGGSAVGGEMFDTFVKEARSNARDVTAKAPLLFKDSALFEPMNDPVISLLAAATTFTAYAVAGFGLALLLFAKLALGIVLVFGPLFVALLVFDSTRGLFFGWLSQTLNFIILTAILTIMVTFVSGTVLVVTQQMTAAIPPDAPNVSPYVEILGAQIGIMFLGGVFFLQAPGLASGIAGGGAAGFGQFVSAVLPGRMALSVTKSAGRSLGPAGSSGTMGVRTLARIDRLARSIRK